MVPGLWYSFHFMISKNQCYFRENWHGNARNVEYHEARGTPEARKIIIAALITLEYNCHILINTACMSP